MPILRPGDTCWRTAAATRAAVLMDNEAYFAAVAAALATARHSVLLLGWGFDPRTRLFPDGFDADDDPDEVGRILVERACALPGLDVRLLVWKSALPIAASQEFFPHKARRYFEDTPVKFRLDADVPFGGCHHQKVLVIDDAIAFCGSGDLVVDRWDTPGHLDVDPRRIMPRLNFHPPRHEVMAMVDGEAARALGDLVRARWLRATGESVAPPPRREPAPGDDPWPAGVEVHLHDAEVGIACTAPAWRGEAGAQEILRLTLECIQRAERTIYLENQYFASPIVTEALARRLAEPNGPQVVLVTTGVAPSWFDRMTMDRARAMMIWRLRAADVYGRFRAWWPVTSSGVAIIVHSKVTIIDDCVIRISSANLNNRSGGFDTEAELCVEARDPAAQAQAARLRNTLIGHFLGCTPEDLGEMTAACGGLIEGIDALNRAGRLQPLKPKPLTAIGELIAAYHLGDPAGVGDSWRPSHRRDILRRAARDPAHAAAWDDPRV